MILVKELKQILKENISLWINFGPDENNFYNMAPYCEEYDNYTIEDISCVDGESVLVATL